MTRTLCSQIAVFSSLGLLFAVTTALMLSHPIPIDAIRAEGSVLKVVEVHTQDDVPANNSLRLAEIQARPLFLKSRRPYEPPLAPAAAPVETADTGLAVPADALILKGVFLKPSVSKALIMSPTTAQGIWVPLGAEIEGWKIEEVTASAVRLTQRQKSRLLTLYPKELP